MIIAHICPLHSSNSRSQTFPRHLQSEALITSFLENPHKRMVHLPSLSVPLFYSDSKRKCIFPNTIHSYIVVSETAKAIVDAWLNAEFQGGRHQTRIDMIHKIEE